MPSATGTPQPSPVTPQPETPTPTASALPTWTGTPPTPTPLSQPYLIEVLDWELVQAASPPLCASCAASTTSVQAPPGMGIVVIQVFIQGPLDAGAGLETDLLYAEAGELTCTRQSAEEMEFCGLLFGQVAHDQVSLTARHISGGESRLEYILTFQKWAPYR